MMPVSVALKWGQTVMGLSISGGVPTTWYQLWMERRAFKKIPKPWEGEVPTLKYSVITWDSHCSAFWSTQYQCCVEGYVSDIQNIRRWVSLLGFILLFLRFVNGHRQTHEDFGADCSKKAEESHGKILIALCQSVESAFLDLIILSTMWKLNGKEPALAAKLYKPNTGYASQSAWEEDCCWLLQHAFGFLDGFVVVTTQEPELVNSSGSFKAGSGQTCQLCQVSLVFEESSQEFFHKGLVHFKNYKRLALNMLVNHHMFACFTSSRKLFMPVTCLKFREQPLLTNYNSTLLMYDISAFWARSFSDNSASWRGLDLS